MKRKKNKWTKISSVKTPTQTLMRLMTKSSIELTKRDKRRRRKRKRRNKGRLRGWPLGSWCQIVTVRKRKRRIVRVTTIQMTMTRTESTSGEKKELTSPSTTRRIARHGSRVKQD